MNFRETFQQRPRQQPGLAQDLEAVADPEHEATFAGELFDLGHDRGKARDRAGPEVVPVGEATRHDHRVDALKVVVGVPQQHRVPHPCRRLQRVDVVARAGKPDHAELHCSIS
jgi:hypothetical protein